jgi:purine-binding chemotaxis protein CheW
MSEASRKQKTTPTGDFQIVTFFLSQEEFGVDILLVQEIIRPSPVTEVPNTPQFVEGVINLRGKVVPVIDLRKRLNIPVTEADKATRIIIIELEKRVTGFVVDSVSKVITVPAGSVQSAPDMIMSGVESEYITGVSRIDDRLIILLDFSKILTAGEQRELAGLR